MNGPLSLLVDLILKGGWAVLLANEVRGLILAGPVLYAMYQSGGAIMTIWLGFCSLAGIALSVFMPVVAMRKLRIWLKIDHGLVPAVAKERSRRR